MEPISKKLDFLVRHWAAFPRRFPARVTLISADLVGRKSNWVRSTFNTCNFSLILRGRGRFLRSGREWVVEAPCVITQWPGEHVEYGPGDHADTWDELYFVYHRSSFAKFKAARLLDPALPVWPIRDPASLEPHIAEFAALAQHPQPALVADRVDRIAERIILETWSPPPGPIATRTPIHAAAESLRARLSEPLDIDALASGQRLSASTFRRRWLEAIGTPPARYLQNLRIAEARRALVETNTPIREIASNCGFEDEFYFSRCFRRATGIPPREYRKTFRLERSL